MNQLKLSVQQSILILRKRGWSQRDIAKELGIDRETVSMYVRLEAARVLAVHAGTELSKPAISTAGSLTWSNRRTRTVQNPPGATGPTSAPSGRGNRKRLCGSHQRANGIDSGAGSMKT